MTIWAIADLHLSFGVEGKKMDVFGEKWTNHSSKLEKNWREMISDDDLVLIAGDISWALNTEDAIPDLKWIDSLPGTKVMIKGNHDLWWKSTTKVRAILPPSIHIIHNDSFLWKDIAIAGSRLWERADISYGPYIVYREIPAGVNVHKKEETKEERLHDEKVFKSEMNRLTWSLNSIDKKAKHRIAMVHYPPAGPEDRSSDVMQLLEDHRIDICLYGHLHNLKSDAPVNFTRGKMQVICTACDFLDFKPVKLELS